MLTILLILICLAVILPMLGVTLDGNVTRIIAVVLFIALVVWMVTGGVPSLR